MGQRELAARSVDVAEPELGDAEPEVELVVLGCAAHFSCEGLARGLEVARFHRGDPLVEEEERRIVLDARELGGRLRRPRRGDRASPA